MHSTLIPVERLKKQIGIGWIIVDCRYDLADKQQGRRNYLESHIPGAVFADVYEDLSGPPITDQGRHPLPIPEEINRLARCLGINAASQVVVYDSSGGAFAGRLWWMLRYMGHQAVALLDGGWQAWQSARLPVHTGAEKNIQGTFNGEAKMHWLVTADSVPGVAMLIDSRDPARYRGETEPLDRVAGHIPGAINHYWKNNLTTDGRFKSRDVLRAEFVELFGETLSEEAVFYCGSGVTACHNLLAAVHAGLPMPRLYAGSWSDWCADPTRPVATGP